MENRYNQKSGPITFLLLVCLSLPFAAFIGASEIEEYYFSSRKAVTFWLVTISLMLIALRRANSLALRTTGFKALGPILIISCIGFSGVFGWLAKSAWNNYPAFHGSDNPRYFVGQNSIYPNHFLFRGSINDGSGNRIIREILGAEKVDWQKPVVLELQSDGGRPQEAMLIGNFVKHYKIQVEVVGKCISACVRILLSSHSRYVHPRAWVGFHATYSTMPGKKPSYELPSLRYYDETCDDLLKEVGASEEFRERAQVQDAFGAFFPTYEELEREGIINNKSRRYLSKKLLPYYL